MEVEKSIEATITDYVQFFPEEIRNDYEVMLRRCNFHDATDPCFPILLFLLFFQESICEKIEQLESSIQETHDEIRKKPVSSIGTTGNHQIFRIIMVLLMILNLTISAGWFAYNAFADRFPKTEQIKSEKEPTLEDMNRYWIAKLEGDEHSVSMKKNWQWLGYLVLCICSSAAGSLLILAIVMRKLRKLEDNPPAPGRRLFGTTRKKRILQLFAHNSDAKPKTEEQTEKTANDITKK